MIDEIHKTRGENNAIQFPCRLKEGKKRKVNEKINEIRKHKLPIISLKKVKLVGASRVFHHRA